MFRRSKILYQLQSTAFPFVPPNTNPNAADVGKLQTFLHESKKVIMITGAGLSTESGIPDYRSENVGLYATSTRRPMTYQDFIKSDKNRQRYWARNFVGWPSFASFNPNDSHKTIASWEKSGKVKLLVTQNVDALHSKAGSENVVELHGCTHRVVCLSCHSTIKRWDLQKVFTEINPNFSAESLEIAPDGDVVLTEEQIRGFKVPPCQSCGGVLKPDVVFFGDNVPRPKVEHVFEQVEDSDAMVIAGSSLYVYSAYRFVRRARDRKIPIAVINIGETRADQFVQLKINARCGLVLPQIKLEHKT